jgi:hypothetical protein
MVRTLWDILGEIEDRRGRQGRQYALRSVLGILIAAMLAGANDLIAIFRWGRRLKPEALWLLGVDSGKAPRHVSYHYFLSSIGRRRLEPDARDIRARRRHATTFGHRWQDAQGQPPPRRQGRAWAVSVRNGAWRRDRRDGGQTRSERDRGRCGLARAHPDQMDSFDR